MKNNQSIKKFAKGDKIVCTLGINKGSIFIVEKVLDSGYSCTRLDSKDDKHYRYTDTTAILKK